jgi:hypothetical protein
MITGTPSPPLRGAPQIRPVFSPDPGRFSFKDGEHDYVVPERSLRPRAQEGPAEPAKWSALDQLWHVVHVARAPDATAWDRMTDWQLLQPGSGRGPRLALPPAPSVPRHPACGERHATCGKRHAGSTAGSPSADERGEFADPCHLLDLGVDVLVAHHPGDPRLPDRRELFGGLFDRPDDPACRWLA